MDRKFLFSFVLFFSAHASADCLPDYNHAVVLAQLNASNKTAFAKDVVLKGSATAVAASGGAGVAIYALGATQAGAAVATTVVGLPILSTAGAVGMSAYLDQQVRNVEVVQTILMQAQLGGGLELHNLHESISQTNHGVTAHELASLIIQLNDSRVLCTPNPLTYSDLQELLLESTK